MPNANQSYGNFHLIKSMLQLSIFQIHFTAKRELFIREIIVKQVTKQFQKQKILLSDHVQ